MLKSIRNSANCQHPFGMLMKERSYTSAAYRYSFNGKEKDDEISGSGNNLDFGARIYDSRLGRWMSVDPLFSTYPNISPYTFVNNNPVIYIDPDGRKLVVGNRNDVNKYFIDLGLGEAFKIKKNGTVKVRKNWERRNSDLLNSNPDLKDIYEGIKTISNHKSKTVEVKSEEGNYDHVRTFPIFENILVRKEIYEDLPDGEGGIKKIYVGWELVEEKRLIGYQQYGTRNNSTSMTFFFGSLDPYNIDIVLHKPDMNKSLDGKNGQPAEGSETAAFIHELLDHGLDFVNYGVDPDAENIKGDESDVKYENKARGILRLNERTGKEHEN